MPAQTSPPELSDRYALSEEQIASYRENGHICLRGVCSAEEVAYYRQAINRVTDERRKELAAKPLEERDTYGKAFLQMTNLWEDGDEDVVRFVMSQRFGRIAAELLGVDGTRIYHDQALYKEAGGGHTPWHQDQHYWPLETDSTVTMWMPLVDVDESMGTMNFASGSHTVGYLGDIPISDESEAKFRRYCAEQNFEIFNYGSLKAGDATFHSGWCLHGAPGNETDRVREVMTIIWYPDGIKILPYPDPEDRWNQNRWVDLKRWFPGRQPGEEAVSELSPLVYKRG